MTGESGSVQNRFRFAREIIRAVRPVMPDECLISFRISNWGVADMKVPLFEKDEWRAIIGYLDEEPVDVISVSTLNYSDSAFGTSRNMAQLTREETGKPLLKCEGLNRELIF